MANPIALLTSERDLARQKPSSGEAKLMDHLLSSRQQEESARPDELQASARNPILKAQTRDAETKGCTHFEDARNLR